MSDTFKGIGAHAITADRWPRTQREAGIEFKPWESRLPPMRPLWPSVMIAGIAAAVVAAWVMVTI